MNTIRKMTEEFKNNWSKNEKLWLIFATIAILATSIYDKALPIEIITGLIGVIYVILIAKGYNISNLVGIIYVSIYGIIAWKAKFYGDMLMNVVLVPLYILAFIQWKRHTKQGLVEARNLSAIQTIITFVTVILAMLTFNILLTSMGGEYTLADSANSVLTVTAMVLTVGRYSQQWICWLTNNIISTSMWVVGAISGLNNINISIVILKILILANSIWGLIHWFRMGKKNTDQ